jgi:hypothetical protein
MQKKFKAKISQEDALVPPIHDEEWQEIFDRQHDDYWEEHGLPPSSSSLIF